MARESPAVDGRSRDRLRAELLGRVPHYTPEWAPDEDDVGAALVDLFADMAADVTDRLDRVPHKGFVAFLDALGFDRMPPQPARVPLAFEVVETLTENVPVPAGTTVLAPAADEAPEQPFEIAPGAGFEATPARLTHVFSADPAANQLRAHRDALDDGVSTTLFAGPAAENLQQHRLYVGHADLLTLSSPTTIWVEFDTDADSTLLAEGLTWEFFGTASEDDEDPAWHALDPVDETAPVPLDLLVSPTEQYAVAAHFLQRETPATGNFAPMVDTVVSKFVMADLPYSAETFAAIGLLDLGPFTDGGFDLGDVDIGALYEAAVDASATDHGGHVDLRDVAVGVDSGATVADAGVWAGTATQWVTPAARETLLEQAADLGVPIGSLATSGVVVGLTFPEGAEIAETTVEGVESRWLRCAVTDRDDPWDRFTVRLDGVGLFVGVPPAGTGGAQLASGAAIDPDLLLRNDVPLPVAGASSEPIHPLGEAPRTLDSFYVASDDAFSKAGTVVQLEFVDLARLAADDAASVELSWEYFDGEGWRTLDRPVAKPPDAARLSGNGTGTSSSLSFAVPSDLEPTTVGGHEALWIRARLVDGHYGQPTYEQTATTDYADPVASRNTQWEYTTSGIEPPRFTALRVRYTQEGADPAEHLLAENNHAFGDDLAAAASFSPFSGLDAVTEGQTLFLGFDRPLADGPIQLFVSLPDVEYDPAFHPRVRWEATVEEGWLPLSTRDETESLTRSGLLGFTFAQPTTTRSLFGEERTWLRGRVTRTPFGSASAVESAAETASGSADAAENDDADATACAVPACARRLETTPPALAAGTAPPDLRGLALNAGWAANVRTVADEPLGSSDGTQHQTFALAAAPVTEATVVVDELSSLSTAERDALEAAHPDAVTPVRGPDEALAAFWVEWTAVDDLLGSGPDDRHYHLDRVAGRVTFGDGTHGRVPPIGDANLEATYRTGGGAAGNVTAGTVTELVSAIPFVDSVTNPVAADGGADVESTDAVLVRGPRAVRDRGRAVTAPDFERLARAASRKVARARCVPGLDASGDHTAGWVTVLVVPETSERKPAPSVELRRRVRETVAAAAPASLVASGRLVVRGPAFVEARVDASVTATAGVGLSAVESRVEAALTAHLNPLTGRDGAGWAFGNLPCLSDLYALVEGVEGVDHVETLTLTLVGSGDPITVGEGAALPSVSDDVLVFSGVHDVVADVQPDAAAEEVRG
jgi:predicted phage baseplate assembly protein